MKDGKNATPDKEVTADIQPVNINEIRKRFEWKPKEFPRLFGWEFKSLRTELGYTASEIALQFEEQNIRLTTSRSVYRIEEGRYVKPRYVAALRKIASPEVFNSTLARLRNTPGNHCRRYILDMLRHETHEHLYTKHLTALVSQWTAQSKRKAV